MEETEPSLADQERTPFLANFFFLYSGIASLLGWNALLTAFDFYQLQYPEFEVEFYLPIPKFMGQVIALVLIFKMTKWMSLSFRVYGLLTIMSGLFVVLPLIAYFVHGKAGFGLSMMLIFVFGFANSVMQASLVAITSMFPGKCMALFFTGTGIAGFLISLIRVFILLGFGDSGDGLIIGTIVYFAISAVIQIATMAIYYFFMKSPYARGYLMESRRRTISRVENIADLVANPGEGMGENSEKMMIQLTDVEDKKGDEDNKIAKLNRESVSSTSNMTFVFQVLKKIWWLFFLLWLHYVCTFMMFPGVTFKRTISILSISWSITLIVLVFNVIDTVSKYVARFRWSYNKISIGILICARFLFFATFLIMATKNDVQVICTDWFQILNIAAFAFTNGFATTAVMTMAPELVKSKEKEACGFLMSFPLAFGIVCGTFLALVFKDL